MRKSFIENFLADGSQGLNNIQRAAFTVLKNLISVPARDCAYGVEIRWSGP